MRSSGVSSASNRLSISEAALPCACWTMSPETIATSQRGAVRLAGSILGAAVGAGGSVGIGGAPLPLQAASRHANATARALPVAR